MNDQTINPIQPPPADTIAMVERAMRRCGEDFYRAAQLPTTTVAQQADRAQRLAEVSERRARWWGVLIRHVLASQGGASWVYASAALTAQRHEELEAQCWRDSAAHLRAQIGGGRAARRGGLRSAS